MSHQRIVAAVASVVCVTLLTLGGPAQSSRAERKVKIREFKDAPVVITEVRNLQQEENWFRDLEIEVKNVSDKPVYYILLVIEFPDIPAPPPERRADGSMPLRTFTGNFLDYGDTRLANLTELATEKDKPLNPGATYVFRVPEPQVKGLDYMLREKNLPPQAADRIELELNTISFGDGSGVIDGLRWAAPRKPRSALPEPYPKPRKVKYVKASLTGGATTAPPNRR